MEHKKKITTYKTFDVDPVDICLDCNAEFEVIQIGQFRCCSCQGLYRANGSEVNPKEIERKEDELKKINAIFEKAFRELGIWKE